jgi:hypothetical protein
MQAKVSVPLLIRKGNWVAWEIKITAYLSLKSPPLHKYLISPPDPSSNDEVEQDRQCRSILILYVDDDLASDIRASVTAHASYKVLKNVLLHEKEVRGQILNQKISSLLQGVRSSDDYVREAQSLMIEAHDLGETTYMRNICSQLILGLAPAAKNILLDNLMTLIETNLSSSSTAAEVNAIFHTMEARIRARCHMISNIPSQMVDEQQAMMFAVQQGDMSPQPHATPKPPVPHATPSPPNRFNRQDEPPKRHAVDYVERRCYYCDKPGHIKRNCRKFKNDMQQQVQGDERSRPGRPVQL